MQKLIKFTVVKLNITHLLVTLVLGINTSWSQDIQYGIEIAPSFDFQLQTASNNTWSTVQGNGFLLGLFLDKSLNEHTFLGSAIKFEYIGFNQRSGDFLISSYRIASLNVPLTFKQEIGLTENWFYAAGIGLNYNFLNRQYFFGNWISMNDVANQWQPYMNGGIHYLAASDFDIGIEARYHVLDLWSKDQQAKTQTKTKLFSFDFSLRYTFASR